MNPFVLGSVITSGANILGGLFGMGSQASANKANMELAKYQNEWNEYMWNKQNEYNTPKNQMARYLEAGLNPNLIYGSGSASSGNSTSVPTAANMHVEPLPVPNLGEAANQVVSNIRADRLADADIKQKDSVTEYNKSAAQAKKQEAALTALKVIGERYNNDKNEFERPYLKRIYEANVKKLEASAKDIEQKTEWFDVTYNERMTQLKQAGANLFKTGEKIDAETRYFVQKSFESAETVVYLRSKAEQLQYELDTNPSVETKKAFNETMLELNQSIKEAEEFVAQGGKYGKLIEPYVGVVTDVVDSAMGWYKISKGISNLSKAPKAPAVPK